MTCLQALATTRVVIVPKAGSNKLAESLNSQTGRTDNRRFSGAGSDTDIVVSSARAYASAINKFLSWSIRQKSVTDTDGDEAGATEASPALAMPNAAPKTVV